MSATFDKLISTIMSLTYEILIISQWYNGMAGGNVHWIQEGLWLFCFFSCGNDRQFSLLSKISTDIASYLDYWKETLDGKEKFDDKP